jgi:general stress protein 26
MGIYTLAQWHLADVRTSCWLSHSHHPDKSFAAVSPSQTTLYFIANNVTHKFDELENDPQVNVAFYDTASTSWVSYDAVAKVSQNRDLIHKFWNSSQLPGYFGDLGDGVHKGDADDPRVSLIEIIPSEIRYWVSTKNSIGKTVQMAISSVTGKGSAPGELRIITEAEVNAFPLISQSESD